MCAPPLDCAQLSTQSVCSTFRLCPTNTCGPPLMLAQLSTKCALAISLCPAQYKVCSGFSLCPVHDQDKVHSGNLTDTV